MTWIVLRSPVRRARFATAIAVLTTAAAGLPAMAPAGLPEAAAPPGPAGSGAGAETGLAGAVLGGAREVLGLLVAGIEGLREPLPLPAIPAEAVAAKLAREPVPTDPLLLPASVPDRPSAMLLAIRVAQGLGCRVTQNWAVGDPPRASHRPGSKHYQRYPGTDVGRAIDVYCDAPVMVRYFRWAEEHRQAIFLDDLFHDPIGYSYDAGEHWPVLVGGHTDHVHLSI